MNSPFKFNFVLPFLKFLSETKNQKDIPHLNPRLKRYRASSDSFFIKHFDYYDYDCELKRIIFFDEF